MGFVIPYNSKVKKAFDIVVIFLNVIYIGFTIFYLTFRSGEKATYLQVFDSVMFVIYTVYIVTNFVYAYELPNGEIEKSTT